MSKRPEKAIGNGTGRFGSYGLNEVTDHIKRNDWWAYGGQAEFLNAGSYSWTCPNGTERVHVWVTGGGGGGYRNWAEPAGGGAGSAWRNNIKVTPNQAYDLKVGRSGPRNAEYGGTSWFISPKCIMGGGGAAGSPGSGSYASDNSDERYRATTTNFPGISTYNFNYNPGEGGRHGHVNHSEGEGRGGGGWYAGDKGDEWDGNNQSSSTNSSDSHGMNSGGGSGGHAPNYQGAGGAGGYGYTSYQVSTSPNGYAGRNTSGGDQASSGQRGGGGGGGYYSSTYGCGAGGGVGIWGTSGENNSGSDYGGLDRSCYGNNAHPRGGGNYWGNGNGHSGLGGQAGIGGSSLIAGYGPSHGAGGENPFGFSYSSEDIHGGWPGGGGGGPGTSAGGGRGGEGAIRIMWEGERSSGGPRRYPDQNCGDVG